MRVLLALTLALSLHNLLCWGQNLRRRKRERHHSTEPATHPQQLFSALAVNYPLHFFNPSERRNWRAPGVVSEELDALYKAHPLAHTEEARAKDQEDIWLYENWFFGVANGIILESGALDGLLFSTTYMFEKYANWTSIHVEADPSNFKRLKANRSRAINIHGGLCSEPSPLHYSSAGITPVRGFVELMPAEVLKRWHNAVFENRTKLDELPVAQCLPARILFEELHLKHIDIWVLDVEGGEESVLRGVDFDAVRINAVAVACDDHDLAANKRKTNILESHGFDCLWVGHNCMCKNKSFSPRTAPKQSVSWTHDGTKWVKAG